MRPSFVVRPLLLVVALAAVAALVLAACGDEGGEGGGIGGASERLTSRSPGTTPGQVDIGGFRFQPTRLEVAAGDAVTWVNQDPVKHRVVWADGAEPVGKTTTTFGSDMLDQGDRYEFTFEEPGTYEVGCAQHPDFADERMTVVVQ
jgi:plastocyanin